MSDHTRHDAVKSHDLQESCPCIVNLDPRVCPGPIFQHSDKGGQGSYDHVTITEGKLDE